MAFFYLSHTHEEHKSCTAWRCNSWTCSFVSCCLVFVATKLSKTPKLAFSYFFMFWLITTILSRRSVFSTLSHKILNIYFKETELEENSLKCNCLFTFWKVFIKFQFFNHFHRKNANLLINTININKEHIPPIPLKLPKSQEEIEGSTTKFGSMMIDLEITFGLRYLEHMKSPKIFECHAW